MAGIRLATLFLFMCFSFVGKAQQFFRPEVFPKDSIEFLETMDKFMRDVRKPETKEFMESFEPIWFGGYFSPKLRTIVYETCDKMLEKRMLPFPVFEAYLISVSSFVKSGKAESEFFNWHKGVDYLLEGKRKKRFEQFLNFSEDLFRENALYLTNSVVWKANTNRFTIEYDESYNPIISFEQLDLKCLSRGDSAVIYGGKGKFIYHEKKWMGEGGTVYFDRSELPRNEVYAELGKYEFDIRRATYTANDVVFVNKSFFGEASLKGTLVEKVLANQTPEKASYPQFVSQTDRLRIRDIVRSVDYDGGFSQRGSRIIGSSTEESKATLRIRRGEKVMLTVRSSAFIIRSDQILNDRAEVTFHFEGDSIYHPGVDFKLKSDERKVFLARTKLGVHRTPFFNSYHQLEMYFESLEWAIDDDLIEMKPLFRSTQRAALFESMDYFKEYRFDDLYGLANVNPLVVIQRCMENYGDVMTTGDVARCWKIPENEVKPFLMELSTRGFLSYDFEENIITVKPKVAHYIQSKIKKEDYDIIEVNSDPKNGDNAVLNLMTMELTMEGVRRIGLSDSHNVFIYPVGGEIVMHKNRDFDFSGVVTAGKLEYFGKNFSFDYDSFKIDMPIIDSLRLYVETEEKDKYGQKKLKRVESVIENVNGLLEVDKPNNRSGIIPVKKYPRFTSFKESYVYYEKPYIQDGIYKRDSFYFKIEPFEFDSLDNFQNDAIQFAGTFKSAGIFETFNQKLSLQTDYSLGFRHETPDKGMPTYGGKGTFYNDIILSHDGLKGNGYLEYLTSTAESKSFFFFPDSMNAIAQNFFIEEQMGAVEYPPVTGSDVEWHFEPYRDTLSVEMIDQPLRFYDGKSTLKGHITYSPESLTGNGKFEFENAILESNLMTFKFSEFDSDTADFSLRNGDLGGIGFVTNNIKAHVDFKKRMGEFESNGESSIMEFKDNQYIARMDRFKWFMDQETVELSGKKRTEQKGASAVSIEGAKLTSIHPDQDSLFFYSSACRWDTRTSILTANQVENIEVADAIVFPDSQRVVILHDAVMKPLKNAKVTANAITRFHQLYNAELKILGKKKYEGKADYDYIDERGEKLMINFEKLYSDATVQTVAEGTIEKLASFTLSPDFKFYGNVYLTASEQELTFDGKTQIKQFCQGMAAPWFKFKSAIDPLSIYIPIDSLVESETGIPLKKGVILSLDPYKMYPTFISMPIRKTDKEIMTAQGYLFFDKTSNEYRISNLPKLEERSLPGNYISYHREDCWVYGEGEMDYGLKLGRVGVSPFGETTYDMKKDSLGMRVTMIVDFFFEDKALKEMTKEIEERTDLDRYDFDRDVFQKNLKEIVGETDGLKLISDLSFYGGFKKFPKELEKALVFSEVQMEWNPTSSAYESVGPINVGNILKKELYVELNGKIQLKKRRSGDILNIYLELDKKNWYYFNYQTEILQAISSNSEFNQKILDVKTGKNKLEREKGQAKYKFILSNKSKKAAFLRSLE